MNIRRCAILCIFIIIITSSVFLHTSFATPVTFIEEYTYNASDIDSKVSSRAIALEQVKRALLEQLGTFLISETEVKNYQMTKDQITTLTAGIVSAEVIDEKWDGRTYYLKAIITAEPKEMAKSIDTLKDDKQSIKELEDSKKKADDAVKEVVRLRKVLELVKADVKQLGDYNAAINDISAADWFDKGNALAYAGNAQSAIEAYSNGIDLNPNNADAYKNRGICYAKLNDFQHAIDDVNKAIELNPQFANAYAARGVIYRLSGRIQQAITDLSRAVKLNPKNDNYYVSRGLAYYDAGSMQRAIKDFDKSIKLNPNNAKAYHARADAFDKLGNSRQAIKDYNKATELQRTAN